MFESSLLEGRKSYIHGDHGTGKDEIREIVKRMTPTEKFIDCEFVGAFDHPRSKGQQKIVVKVLEGRMKGEFALVLGMTCHIDGDRVWVHRNAIIGCTDDVEFDRCPLTGALLRKEVHDP